MALLQTKPLLTWTAATWEEFIQIADNPASAKLKSYYNNGRMRIEPMSTGSDHSNDHTVLIFAITLFATLRGIPITTKDGCSYRKPEIEEFQPDASCYIGNNANAIPWGTRVVNLQEYPVPDLVIEVADTSLSDDKGEKRLQYEESRIPEYWIVDVQKIQIIAFAIAADGSSRQIRESQVLPGLSLSVLETALSRSRQDNQSIVGAWLMEQFHL